MTFESQTTDKAGQDQLDAVAAEFDSGAAKKQNARKKSLCPCCAWHKSSLSTIRPPKFAAD